MDEQSKQAALAVDHGLKDCLDQIAAKVIFLKCVLPEDALGDQAHFGFGLILGDIAEAIRAAGTPPEREGVTMETQEHPAMASTLDRAEKTSMARRKYDELEARIEDLRNMSIVLETLMDDLWKQEDYTKKSDLYKSFLFTNDQLSSTQFAVSKIGDMARELSKYFHSIDESE
jgi:hypothetical protein